MTIFKGVIYPKMKILPFTHSRVIQNLYDVLITKKGPLTRPAWKFMLVFSRGPRCLLFNLFAPSLISLGISLSDQISFQVPTVPPGNVQAEAVNSTTVRFTWSAPSPQFINGINQGYKVNAHLPPSSGPAQDCGDQ